MKPLLAHDAPAAGLTYRMFSNAQWVRVSHGLYAPTGSIGDLKDRCQALSPVLPEDALLSHYTAASVLELWLPQLPSSLPTFATVPGRGTHLKRRGLYLARSDGATLGVLKRGELKLAPVSVVLGQLAEDLSCLDMVIAIDSALHHGYCSLSELTTSIRRRQRGAPILRQALRYAHPLSESPWETAFGCCTSGPASRSSRSTWSTTTGATSSRAAI